jgi:hypothetical protein
MGTCGIGGWGDALPGDPSNDITIAAVPAFGGIDVSWTMPSVNPHAIAYVRVYRGITNIFDNAILKTEVGGTFFYDKVATGTTYYYWVRIVSKNGTVNLPIGPASAVSKPIITDLIAELSGQINESELATSLRTKLDRITMTEAQLQAEIEARLADNLAYQQLLDEMNSGLTGGLAAIVSESGTRADADSAIAWELNQLAAVVVHPATGLMATRATLQNDYYVKATVDTAISTAVTGLISQANLDLALGSYVSTAALTAGYFTKAQTDSAIAGAIADYDAQGGAGSAAILDVVLTKVGYSAIAGDPFNTPYDGDHVTTIYPVATYPTATYPEYQFNRTRIIDELGVDLWNATAAGLLKPLVWIPGLPLASAVRQVEVADPNGGYSAIEVAMSSQKTLNDVLKSQYTVKLDANGKIAGFGIYNDPTGSLAVWNVDRFAIGQTGATTLYPFIVDAGTVYMTEAAIAHLTFTKLRDEGGTFIVENGKVKADYISGKGLNITALDGSPVVSIGANSAGSNFLGNVTGNIDGTAAGTVKTNASTALANANAAVVTADAANLAVTDMASDSKLTAVEKQALKKEWDILVSEKLGINTQASNFSVTTENTSYNDLYAQVNAYLNTTGAYGSVGAGSNMLADLTVTSNLDKTYAGYTLGGALRKLMADFYSARQALLNKIAETAATRAVWSSVSGAGKPEDNATVGAPAGTSVNGVPVATLTGNIDTTLAAVNALADDNTLTPVEKFAVIQDYETLTGEQADLVAKLNAFGLTGRRDAYNAAIAAVTSALTAVSGNGPTTWSNTAGNTLLTGYGGGGLRNLFRDAFIHRQWAINDLTNTAQTNANARLAAGSRNVLAGAGGLSIGGLDWWGDGTYKSGNGIGITANGMVAYSGGLPKFTLAADGSATFSGTLAVGNSPATNGTTMTGSGALVNPNGTFVLGNATTNITFNGSQLTLNGNVVATGNMLANSVTESAGSATGGEVQSATHSSSLYGLLNHTYYSLPTTARYMALAYGNSSSAGGNTQVYIQLTANGSVVAEITVVGGQPWSLIGTGTLVGGGTLDLALSFSNPTGYGNASVMGGTRLGTVVFKR